MQTRTTPDGARIVTGPGAESAAATHLIDLGATRVLLIAQDRYRDGADRIAAALGERSGGVFTTDRPQVPGEIADAAVTEALRVGADWVLSHGGGTPVGIAKAVALRLPVSIAAVPTTYAGSERTDIWGITRDGVKTTGRDPRVLPRLVLYDPTLTTALPVTMSLQSLLNAAAHSVEALYAPDATDAIQDAAEESLSHIVAGMSAIAADPTDLVGRAVAQHGACLAGTALGGASMALHHKLAHVLGGSFSTPHAATHAILLPYTLAHNAPAAPEAMARIRRALSTDDPAAHLYDLARSLGLKTGLSALGLTTADVDRIVALVLQKQYKNPRPLTAEGLTALLLDGLHDRRPSAHTRRLSLGLTSTHTQPASLRGAPLAQATAAILVVHGRGSSADRFLADIEAILPDTTDLTLLAPQATDRSWYPRGFAAPLADNQPHLDDALAALDAAFAVLSAHVPPHRIAVVGFSQGACLALTWASSTAARPGALIAMTGAAADIGGDFSAFSGVSVHLSRSEADPWVPADALQHTADALRTAGATVTVHTAPGSAHTIHPADADALRRTVAALSGASNV
ncbi:MAG: maleylacetate reductase [Myxococcota bacterium]|jgi:maleylacetate reductase